MKSQIKILILISITLSLLSFISPRDEVEFLKENPKIAQEIEDKIRANSSALNEAMTAPQETDETE